MLCQHPEIFTFPYPCDLFSADGACCSFVGVVAWRALVASGSLLAELARPWIRLSVLGLRHCRVPGVARTSVVDDSWPSLKEGDLSALALLLVPSLTQY